MNYDCDLVTIGQRADNQWRGIRTINLSLNLIVVRVEDMCVVKREINFTKSLMATFDETEIFLSMQKRELSKPNLSFGNIAKQHYGSKTT